MEFKFLQFMGKKITCKACGKVWNDGEEYLKDKKKCGSNECVLLTPATNITVPQTIKENDIGRRNKNKAVHIGNKTPIISVSTDTIRSKVVPKDTQVMYYEVPKVIVTKMRMG